MQGCSHPLIRPKPVFGISTKDTREVIKNWTSRNTRNIGRPLVDNRRLRAFLKDPMLEEMENSIWTGTS